MITTLRHYWRLAQEDRQRRQPVVSAGTQPIILGPWLGEVGPELQYWIPFLQQLKHSGAFGNRRLIAVSRGGVSSWYQQLTSEYIEIFDYKDKTAYQAVRAERSTEKQFDWTTGERNLVKTITDQFDITEYDTLHPGAMWLRILPYFKEQQGLSTLLDQLQFQPINQTSLQRPANLPERYIAVRFYQSDLFPATPDNQQFLADLLQQLTQHHTVVALVTNSQLNEHAQFPMPSNSQVQTVVIDQELKRNLGLQTQIIAHADAFVGTYGGLTILPGLLGKPCFGFIGADLGEQRAIHFRHEAVTQHLYQSVGQPYLIQSVASWCQLIELATVKTKQ